LIELQAQALAHTRARFDYKFNQIKLSLHAYSSLVLLSRIKASGPSSSSFNVASTLFQQPPNKHVTASIYYNARREKSFIRYVHWQFHGLSANTDYRSVPLVRLGSSGLKVSQIILGCMSYGSPEWQQWVLPEEESIKHIKAA
jgi:hypothetical protein